VHDAGLSQFRVSGFTSFDEARAYAQRVFKDAALRPYVSKGRVLLVSKENLDLIGTSFSINDYQKFYDTTFAPIKPSPDQPVEEGQPIEQHYEDEYTPEELEEMQQEEDGESDGDDDGGEWY